MSSQCPSKKTLEQFLLGYLDGPTAAQIERHFERCERCGQVAAKITGTDRLTDAMQTQPVISHEDETQLADLSSRLLGLSAKAETLTSWEDQSTVLHGLFEAFPTSCKISTKIYYRQEFVFSTPLDKSLEIGRQGEGDPPPYCRLEREPVDRVVVAPLQQTKVSRRHLQIVHQESGKVKATSLTSKGDIVINGKRRLCPSQSYNLELPALLQLGEVVIRLEAA